MTSCRPLHVMTLAVGLCIGSVCSTAAATIELGTRIPLTADTFALPIEITDAENVAFWEFALTYDPTDVLVNTDCDPFSGDVYCSLFTGPVTEGEFFAAGAPFNLLVPGVVALDGGLNQTGSLFGVNGAYGGFLPAPSGDGVIAYVEFLIIGTGESTIVVEGSATSVPEPATFALLGAALLLRRTRRLVRGRVLTGNTNVRAGR
jgi:hypothetical protein